MSALALLCGCAGAEIANTEQLLGAAGFQILPATSPERQNQLALLPSHQVLVQEQQGNPARFTYIYSDPDQCHCLWIGDPRNYQAFQQFALQQRIADQQLLAAQLYSGPWGPWGFWGPGFGSTVIVEPSRHHKHHHHDGDSSHPPNPAPTKAPTSAPPAAAQGHVPASLAPTSAPPASTRGQAHGASVGGSGSSTAGHAPAAGHSGTPAGGGSHGIGGAGHGPSSSRGTQ